MENNLLYNDYELVITDDGSHSIRFAAIDEGYHSTHGAIKEAMHVYILPNMAQHIGKQNVINVFEMGFGTALNAFLSYLYAKANNCQVHYTAVEAYPIPKDIYNKLNYAELCVKEIQTLYPEIDFGNCSDDFFKLHTAKWDTATSIAPHFKLTKRHCTIQDINLPKKLYHSIYYDAFAPQFQPELWSKDIFDKLRQASSPHAILTTYCCKGDVKRALKAAGYTIEKLPGPKGKREMLRAKIENQPTVKLYKQSL